MCAHAHPFLFDGVLSLAAAARLVGGDPADLDGFGAAPEQHFAETARSLEAVFRQAKEQEEKEAN